jgi:hypothetical protein
MLSQLASKDSSRDREYAVILITRVTVTRINVMFRLKDKYLACGLVRRMSSNSAPSLSLTPLQSGPKPMAMGPNGYRPLRVTRAGKMFRSSGM